MVQKVKINVIAKFSDGQLDLSMSDLDEVPVKEIASLKKTHSLDLSNNRLACLPSTFSCLSFLTKLDLSRNELTELPEDFGSLSKLRYLDLYKNNLERLPLSFSQLVGLKFLDLKDNPLIPTIAKVAGPCLDNKGCQQCAKDVVRFFKQLEQEVEMRKQIRQKQVEINQQKKQAEKRRLKKERQGKATTDIERVEDNVPDLPSHVTPKIRAKEIMKACPTSTKHSLFALFVYCMFLCTLVLWFLFAWRVAWTRKLAPEIYNYYQILLDKLPYSLKTYAQYLGDYVVSLQLGTRHISQQCANIVYNSEIVKTLVTKVYSLIGENTS